ncbi:hypothetical protein Bbelb_391590 [Branchiostoma belcheri]|nr:hypothetical protein Bbelb_391590 [Branchiostoma belcheri]
MRSPRPTKPEKARSRGVPARDPTESPLDPARDPVAARPECKSRSAPYRIPYGSRRGYDWAPGTNRNRPSKGPKDCADALMGHPWKLVYAAFHRKRVQASKLVEIWRFLRASTSDDLPYLGEKGTFDDMARG